MVYEGSLIRLPARGANGRSQWLQPLVASAPHLRLAGRTLIFHVGRVTRMMRLMSQYANSGAARETAYRAMSIGVLLVVLTLSAHAWLRLSYSPSFRCFC